MQIRSILNDVLTEINSIKDLDRCKEVVVSRLNQSNIKEVDKLKMIYEIGRITSYNPFIKYVYNALLKYEGLGIVK